VNAPVTADDRAHPSNCSCGDCIGFRAGIPGAKRGRGSSGQATLTEDEMVCAAAGCDNSSVDGRFAGDFCSACDADMRTGRFTHGTAAPYKMAIELARLRKIVKDIEKAAGKRIRVQSPRKLEEALDYATGGDACESYRLGVEEAQGEITSRIRELVK
jgi:hypothetical protein